MSKPPLLSDRAREEILAQVHNDVEGLHQGGRPVKERLLEQIDSEIDETYAEELQRYANLKEMVG